MGRAAIQRSVSVGPARPTSEAELSAKWEAEAAHFEQLGVSVNGAALCRAFLDDLRDVQQASDNRVLSLKEAAGWSGYSEAHLARLVKEGKLRTLRPPSSRGRLAFHAGDLPRKPCQPHSSDAGVHDLASRLGIRGKGGHRGQA